MNAFDPHYENREVWVLDPVTRQSWHKSLLESSPASGLTADQVDSLSSVNTQFHQAGAALIVAGGYGYKRSVADHRTYDTLSRIDLPGLIGWVKQAPGSETTQAAQHIQQIRHSYFQVTGGSLEKIGDEYQLVMVQNYEGRYRPNFNGVYTQQVRRFLINETAGGLVVPPASMMHPKVLDVADAGNGGSTGASGRVFEVVLTPLDPPSAVAIATTPGQVSLQWPAAAEDRYVIECSDDLNSWTELTAPLSGMGMLEWSEARTTPAAFYRVLSGSLSREPSP
jgi:hypothetical protein